MPNVIPQIRVSHNQMGMQIDAKVSPDAKWQIVEIQRYREYRSTSVKQYSTCIDPKRQENEYFAELDERGIAYQRFSE